MSATDSALDVGNFCEQEEKLSHPGVSWSQNLFLCHQLWMKTSRVFIYVTRAAGGGVWHWSRRVETMPAATDHCSALKSRFSYASVSFSTILDKFM